MFKDQKDTIREAPMIRTEKKLINEVGTYIESQEESLESLKFLEVNHQQDATQLRNFYYSTYVNSSTCFERYVAHHQEPQLC
jgi:hypothetical protein